MSAVIMALGREIRWGLMHFVMNLSGYLRKVVLGNACFMAAFRGKGYGKHPSQNL